LKAIILAEPILVGRERELEELRRYLDSAFKGKGITVFVSGEAGSGKTRLVNEFLRMVKEKEMVVLHSWCLSDLAVPYFPFMEAFDAYFKARTAAEKESISLRQSKIQAEQTENVGVKAWLMRPKQTEKPEKLQNLTPQAWQDSTIVAVFNALLSISARNTVILFIDDLHWADSASLSLLHYISRSIGSARILVLATYRSEELILDAEGRPHPLLETLRLMRREGLLKEIKLSNLEKDDVAALGEKMVGGHLHPEFSNKLAEESHGNPLFVVESLRMLSDQGSLIQDNGKWSLSIDEVGIPDKIKDIILRRVSILRPNQRRILDLASVIGEKFDSELLSAVIGQGSLEVLETLDSIEQFSSLVHFEDNYYKFDHAKSREAIYEQISKPLKKQYHARIAEKMEVRSNGKDLPVNDLAYHFAQAGNRQKAVEYALASGEDALARFSNAEAAKYYSYVLGAVSESLEYVDERTRALEGLGDALTASNLFAEALKKFELLSSVVESGAVKLRAFRKAFLCSYWRGDRAHAHELAAMAEEYARFDRLEYARLRLYRGFMAGREGKDKEALLDEEAALRVFEEEFSLRDMAAALSELVFIPHWNVPIEVRLAMALRSVALYRELEDLRDQVLAYHRLGGVFIQAGLFQEARNAVDESLRIGEQVGEYNFMSLSLWSRGLSLQGIDVRKALAVSLKAVEYAERTSAYYTQCLCYGNLVMEYALLGEIEHAEEYVQKAEKLLDEVGKAGDKLDAVDAAMFVRSCKTFISEAKGQWKEVAYMMEKLLGIHDARYSREVPPLIQVRERKRYARALEKEGRIEEAQIQLEEARKIEEETRERVNRLRSRLEHAEVKPYLMARREIGLGDELSVWLDLVNVGKNSAKLVKVEGLMPPGFIETMVPSYCSVEDNSVVMNQKELNPFTVETVKISLRATKAGVFSLSPQVVYIDNLGESKTCRSQPVGVTVHPMLHAKIGEETVSVPVLPGRVTTGFADLDVLLFGGIPENYAVLLTSSSVDERDLLVKRFLEAGADTGETTFYVTGAARTAKILAEKYPLNFYLVLCNPRADASVPDLTNVLKLKGIESLTEIDIALTKAFRMVEPSAAGSKRICLEIISDVLLQHHAVITRKWLSALLPTLKQQGFTVLAVLDPTMHPAEEIQAVKGLFEGEMGISEKETLKGFEKVLRIHRLSNQKYLEDELTFTREKLE
jgi:KaiC/GvpD/RAD55 family RecA-like ATPase/tetratricopeptide (TPR) repeat protein